jgi:hypothetical protein
LVNFGFFVLVLEKSAPSFVVNLIRLINLWSVLQPLSV